MNKKILYILFSFLVSSASFLEVSAQKLTIENATVNCGRTGFEQPITATFELRNKGMKRLFIESVRPDCGCTAVEFPKEVGAGDKFTIRMTYDARQLGHFHKMAAVKSNGSKAPVYLTMTGVVLPEVLDYTGDYPYSMGDLLLDKTELEYDDVNKGDTPVQEIHVMNNGTVKMTPNVMHLPPYLSAIVKPETVAPGRSATITVMLNSEKLRDYGLTQTIVHIGKQLGEKVSADNEMSVSAVLLPDLKAYEKTNKAEAPQLQISATDIDFTDFGGKAKKTADITLLNTGHSPLTISSLQMFTSGLKVTLGKREIASGQSTVLKVTGFANELARLRTRPRILMITNDPTHAKVVVNIKLK
ncbi:MAG: DUF1573 domain-containing protein [Prevotella sp.]|nr:DUF1573 domain-containing protein [Prevotella sp.]